MTPEAIVMWPLLKDTAASWSDHKASRLGAALAYYSIFSLGPLIVIAVAIAGLTFGQEAVRGEVSAQLRDLLGSAGAQAVNAMLVGASKPMEGALATVLGLGALLFAAIGATLLFAMMFKWLPDTDVAWRDVWLGAAVTAVLFEIGKFLIGLYIRKQRLESTYGAAAPPAVFLICVLYPLPLLPNVREVHPLPS